MRTITFQDLVDGKVSNEEFENLETYNYYTIAEECGVSLKNGTGLFIQMDIIAKVREARQKAGLD